MDDAGHSLGSSLQASESNILHGGYALYLYVDGPSCVDCDGHGGQVAMAHGMILAQSMNWVRLLVYPILLTINYEYKASEDEWCFDVTRFSWY